jgi:hypothetical protein
MFLIEKLKNTSVVAIVVFVGLNTKTWPQWQGMHGGKAVRKPHRLSSDFL